MKTISASKESVVILIIVLAHMNILYNPICAQRLVQHYVYGKHLYISEIPRRINSTNIFTSKGDDFDKLGLILASFPPFCIIFRDPFHKIGHWKWFFQPGLNRNNGLRYAKRVFFSR